MRMRLLTTLFAMLVTMALSAQMRLSLSDFGWKTAKTGAQRAKVLYDAQSEALERGTTVDYTGIRRIELEVTSEFKSIPLTGHDDFCGVEFVVKNDAKDVPLFSLVRKGKAIELDKSLLDGTRFSSVPELRLGEHLLVIKDENLWVDNRVGYNYGHTRKDILLIRNKTSLNKVIAPYNNEQSSPVCKVIPVTEGRLYVKNFTLSRVTGSKKKIFCLNVQGVAHLMIESITINTPENSLSGDQAIKITDCADVTLRNVTINNSYSQSNKYGYGININNTWSIRMENVCGTAPWGLLGNNNMSDTYLEKCAFNRFDIHCYGRNVYLKDCTFDGGSRGWYCGGSSIYGVIQYDRCTFINCTPFANGDSYKTAVPVDVVFNDCVFNVTKMKHSIFGTKVLNDKVNPRHGLEQKCLPNIEINRMTVNVPKGVKEVLLYDVGAEVYNEEVGYLRNVKINGLDIRCEDAKQQVDFKLISSQVQTSKALKVNITNLTAPTAKLQMLISSNRKNIVNLSKSSLRPIEAPKGVRLRAKDCNISQ